MAFAAVAVVAGSNWYTGFAGSVLVPVADTAPVAVAASASVD